MYWRAAHVYNTHRIDIISGHVHRFLRARNVALRNPAVQRKTLRCIHDASTAWMETARNRRGITRVFVRTESNIIARSFIRRHCRISMLRGDREGCAFRTCARLACMKHSFLIFILYPRNFRLLDFRSFSLHGDRSSLSFSFARILRSNLDWIQRRSPKENRRK